ncbi:exported protein (PHISTb) [Plasmodium gaboni]|uniref:Exported protein (PHISTb) n=1 Tax=Plasmodium gaboni TaxID=647221 RepID=A0A151L2F8_9APIC|nr:exported protein (PHISTb) [Plasmodium gaboni]KYN93136.1 exported protein (PHISTb) [Plasmodium gaboni]
MNIIKNYKIKLSLVVLGIVHVQSNYHGLNDSVSPIKFNYNICNRILSMNESADVVVETPTEETFNNKNEYIDEKFEESFYSKSGEQTVEEFLSKMGDNSTHGFGYCLVKRANSILRLRNFHNDDIILNEHDILSQCLNGDVSNIFNENKTLFKDLLNKDICTTYEINFDKNSECTLLTNKNDLQINKDILLLGNESEETNKLIDIWKRVVKNEENKFNLLKRNLYNQYLKHRNKSRFPNDKLNNILNECNMVVKKYNNNDDKTIKEIFNKWSTVTPHNIFEFRIFVMAYRLSWRTLIKNLNTEYTNLLRSSFK